MIETYPMKVEDYILIMDFPGVEKEVE